MCFFFSTCVFRSSNLNTSGVESVATLTRSSPLNPQQPPLPPQPIHQPPPPQQMKLLPQPNPTINNNINNNNNATATTTDLRPPTPSCIISGMHGDQPQLPPLLPPPNRDRDHHSLQLNNRDYESVFIIERRNSKPNIR